MARSTAEKERLRWNALTENEKRTEAGSWLPYVSRTYEELLAEGRIPPED